MVRMKTATRERLHSLAKRLSDAACQGTSDVPMSDQPCAGGEVGGVTVDETLNKLIDHYTAHLDRAQRQRSRRARERAEQEGWHDGPAGMLDLSELAQHVQSPSWDATPRVYQGYMDDGRARVSVLPEGGERRRLMCRWDLRNHSPEGFGWGYAGSGPAQLALAILADATDDATALRLYQAFKVERIACLDQRSSWQLDRGDVVAWVRWKDGCGAAT